MYNNQYYHNYNYHDHCNCYRMMQRLRKEINLTQVLHESFFLYLRFEEGKRGERFNAEIMKGESVTQRNVYLRRTQTENSKFVVVTNQIAGDWGFPSLHVLSAKKRATIMECEEESGAPKGCELKSGISKL